MINWTQIDSISPQAEFIGVRKDGCIFTVSSKQLSYGPLLPPIEFWIVIIHGLWISETFDDKDVAFNFCENWKKPV